MAAVFVDFPKNKCNFLHKNKLRIVRLVQFSTERRRMRSFTPGVVVTITLWKSAGPMGGMNDVGMDLEDVQCGMDGCQTDGAENRECYPISVPPDDPVFGGLRPCLMFVRSQEVPNEDCVPGFYSRDAIPARLASTVCLCLLVSVTSRRITNTAGHIETVSPRKLF